MITACLVFLLLIPAERPISSALRVRVDQTRISYPHSIAKIRESANPGVTAPDPTDCGTVTLRYMDNIRIARYHARKGSVKVSRVLRAKAKYRIGAVVKHRIHPFRGVIFDVDPEFANTEEWWLSIPEEMRPHKDQPFYHLFAENETSYYVAYVSEQNLLPDESGQPIDHPNIGDYFDEYDGNLYLFDPAQCH